MILVLGATGYVGSKLAPRLLADGHAVRALVRNRHRAAGRELDGCELVEGDLLKIETLRPALQGIEAVYYLVHSMTSREEGFEERDRLAAVNVARVAKESGVRRIIYLGGLGRSGLAQSAHLRSRHEVGDILRSGGVPVTEFRAAVILGSGSVSFEMIHHLVNRLPMMICPRWVTVRTQPIAIDDALRYLVLSLRTPETAGKIYDIGGPEVLSYRSMMLKMAAILGLRRWLIQVPVLTPRLSSYWVNLVTPIPASLTRALIDSLRHETVCENDEALKDFPFRPVSFTIAVRRAIADILPPVDRITEQQQNLVQRIDPSHILTDRRVEDADVAPDALFAELSSVGGAKGWYYANWLWRLRGAIDKLFGGIGMRRGRRHPAHLAIGDAIDFWRVQEYEPGRHLCLRAEMKVYGAAWLDFRVEPLENGRSRLIQTARYYPKGLFGLLYWWSVYPLHLIIFRKMARAICRAASTPR